MNKQGTILIVDDNKGVLTAVQLLLKNYFTKVITDGITEKRTNGKQIFSSVSFLNMTPNAPKLP